MTVEIEKLRADIRADIARGPLETEKLRAEIRHERWVAIASMGGAFTGGAALLGLILRLMGKI